MMVDYWQQSLTSAELSPRKVHSQQSTPAYEDSSWTLAFRGKVSSAKILPYENDHASFPID